MVATLRGGDIEGAHKVANFVRVNAPMCGQVRVCADLQNKMLCRKHPKRGTKIRYCPPSPRPSPPGEGDASPDSCKFDAAVSRFRKGFYRATLYHKVNVVKRNESFEIEWGAS